MKPSLLPCLLLALAATTAAHADTVVLGTDYFTTTSGTSFTFDSHTFDLKGNPIGPGDTDTIVQRTNDVTIGGGPGALMVTGLSLESTAAVGSYGIVYVGLDPNNLSKDTGQINITGTKMGGSFTSSFELYLDFCSGGIGAGGIGCAIGGTSLGTENINLVNSGASWQPTPTTNSVIVTGPLGNQAADVHTGLPAGDVDFFVSTFVGPTNWPAFEDAQTPVPAALPLFASGLGVIGLFGWRRKRKAQGVA